MGHYDDQRERWEEECQAAAVRRSASENASLGPRCEHDRRPFIDGNMYLAFTGRALEYVGFIVGPRKLKDRFAAVREAIGTKAYTGSRRISTFLRYIGEGVRTKFLKNIIFDLRFKTVELAERLSHLKQRQAERRILLLYRKKLFGQVDELLANLPVRADVVVLEEAFDASRDLDRRIKACKSVVRDIQNTLPPISDDTTTHTRKRSAALWKKLRRC